MSATLAPEMPATMESETWLDSWAFKEIRRRANWLCHRFGFQRGDRDDIEQNLTVEVLARSRNADPRHPNRKALLHRMLKQAQQNLIRDRNCAKRAFFRNARSLSDEVPDGDGRKVPFATVIKPEDRERRTGVRSRPEPEAVALEQDVRSAIASLPRHLQRLCERALNGHGSQSLDHAPPEVLAAIRQHFAAEGLEDYLRVEE